MSSFWGCNGGFVCVLVFVAAGSAACLAGVGEVVFVATRGAVTGAEPPPWLKKASGSSAAGAGVVSTRAATGSVGGGLAAGAADVGDSADSVGTATICWHLGQRAFLPAYLASTLNRA